MEYNIKLDLRLPLNALNQLIGTLDNGPHGLVRPLIDNIIAQATEQDKAAKNLTTPDDVPTPPATPEDAEVKEPTPLP